MKLWNYKRRNCKVVRRGWWIKNNKIYLKSYQRREENARFSLVNSVEIKDLVEMMTFNEQGLVGKWNENGWW